MAYTLRSRNPKVCYASSSDSSDADSSASDPDYTRTRPRRTSAGASTSRRSTEIINLENAPPQRRPGRPPKRKRKVARYSTHETGESSSRQATRSSNERTILSWLIDLGLITDDERVYVVKGLGGGDDGGVDRKLVISEGRARTNGVWCCCCTQVMTVAEFEAHAGSNLGRPYANIFTARTNCSLLQCQRAAWSSWLEMGRRGFNHFVQRDGAVDHHDEACLVCADGGDLLCCEREYPKESGVAPTVSAGIVRVLMTSWKPASSVIRSVCGDVVYG
ncbi:hypothetical protein Tsubulata_046073 [Turnera subulata]|uniref:Tify domain-containing protein n=1 Tax=Turnera subulata TaxID=218843 RepID=A0A9Q0JMD2_9ROSI|nr:hypothetical protein Tsubulata_046073 [Turnera subulata]